MFLRRCRLHEKEKEMYFKQRSDVIYRNYGSFGYITDNRNFGYRTSDVNGNYIGDKVVSESGAVFLSALSRTPQTIENIIKKVREIFSETNIETIKEDAIEFYSALENEGFVVSGMTPQECNAKDVHFYYECNGSGGYEKKDVSQKKEENTTELFFETYFDNVPQLTNLHIEIIGKCNERCIHCYIPHEKKTDVMSPSVFYDILEQSRKMNILHLTISGGEPMAHEHFVDFIRKCNEYNFSVSVLSNLTLLNQKIIEEMKRNPLLSVQTSLYSMDENVHDSITQRKGSFEKTKKAILQLIENNIPIQISCPIMKQNMYCYKKVIEWGQLNNISVNSDYVILARYDHSINNLNCRLSISDVQEVIEGEVNSNPAYLLGIEKEYNKKIGMQSDDFVCSVCHSSVCISEQGNVYPCAGWQDYILGNVSHERIYDIWHQSDKVKYLRNLRRRDFTQCTQCSQKEFCTMCMVRNANENPKGNPLEVNPYFCEVARINKKIYFREKDKKYV